MDHTALPVNNTSASTP